MQKSTRRNFLKTIGLGVFSLGASGLLSSCQKTRKPSNIIFIMADDLGYGDLSCLNEKSKIKTENLDRLAAKGAIFTDAHSGSAVCTPTRYGVLTGRYSWRSKLKSGVLWGYSKSLIPTDRLIVASLLKKHNYNTGCIGKWHLGLDWVLSDNRTPADNPQEKGENVDLSKPIKNGPTSLGFDYFFGISASLDMEPYVYIENEPFTE